MNDYYPFMLYPFSEMQPGGFDFYLFQALKDKSPKEQDEIMRTSTVVKLIAAFGSMALALIACLVYQVINHGL
jgi:hypothetical protein